MKKETYPDKNEDSRVYESQKMKISDFITRVSDKFCLSDDFSNEYLFGDEEIYSIIQKLKIDIDSSDSFEEFQQPLNKKISREDLQKLFFFLKNLSFEGFSETDDIYKNLTPEEFENIKNNEFEIVLQYIGNQNISIDTFFNQLNNIIAVDSLDNPILFREIVFFALENKVSINWVYAFISGMKSLENKKNFNIVGSHKHKNVFEHNSNDSSLNYLDQWKNFLYKILDLDNALPRAINLQTPTKKQLKYLYTTKECRGIYPLSRKQTHLIAETQKNRMVKKYKDQVSKKTKHNIRTRWEQENWQNTDYIPDPNEESSFVPAGPGEEYTKPKPEKMASIFSEKLRETSVPSEILREREFFAKHKEIQGLDLSDEIQDIDVKNFTNFKLVEITLQNGKQIFLRITNGTKEILTETQFLTEQVCEQSNLQNCEKLKNADFFNQWDSFIIQLLEKNINLDTIINNLNNSKTDTELKNIPKFKQMKSDHQKFPELQLTKKVHTIPNKLKEKQRIQSSLQIRIENLSDNIISLEQWKKEQNNILQNNQITNLQTKFLEIGFLQKEWDSLVLSFITPLKDEFKARQIFLNHANEINNHIFRNVEYDCGHTSIFHKTLLWWKRIKNPQCLISDKYYYDSHFNRINTFCDKVRIRMQNDTLYIRNEQTYADIKIIFGSKITPQQIFTSLQNHEVDYDRLVTMFTGFEENLLHDN